MQHTDFQKAHECNKRVFFFGPFSFAEYNENKRYSTLFLFLFLLLKLDLTYVHMFFGLPRIIAALIILYVHIIKQKTYAVETDGVFRCI